MKIGDRVYVHGYVDEIRKDTVIIRNEGGYFGTVKSEIVEAQKTEDIVSVIRCKDCKHYKEWESEFTPNAVVTQCMADNFPIRKAIPDGWFCAGAERRTDESD